MGRLPRRPGPYRIGVVLGTRPEAIKLAPVVLALRSSCWTEPVVISTGQHGDVLRRVLDSFAIVPDVDLDLMVTGQRLSDLAGRAVQRIGAQLEGLDLDLLVVQGDTTTALAGALAGFYSGVPVAHVEAGLRTGDRFSPFPEEVNRRMVTQLADLHLAPTPQAGQCLLDEGVDPAAVVVTGNTVVDALLATVRRRDPWGGPDADRLAVLDDHPGPVLLVTAHRRESWGAGIDGIARAVDALLASHPDLVAVLPVHPNPRVRAAVHARLGDQPRAVLTEPLDYPDLVRVLDRCSLVLTDSGGLQEEACSLGKPTLVTRATTERPEGLAAGGLLLVGTDAEVIEREASRLLDDAAAHDALVCRTQPFGDGRAAPRTVDAVLRFLHERGSRRAGPVGRAAEGQPGLAVAR